MGKSISSVNKEKRNLDNGKCQIMNNNGIVIAEFDGKIEELYCQFFLIKDSKLYAIIGDENGQYGLEEIYGDIL